MAWIFFKDGEAADTAYQILQKIAEDVTSGLPPHLQGPPQLLPQLPSSKPKFLSKEKMDAYQQQINTSIELDKTKKAKGFNKFSGGFERFSTALEYLKFADAADKSVDGHIVSRFGGMAIDTENLPMNFLDTNWSESGEASQYGIGDGFAGQPTAFQAIMDPTKLTVAHKTLPAGTIVEISTVDSSGTTHTVQAVVNDRGPYANDKNGKPRIVDCSPAVFDALGISEDLAQVTLKIPQKPNLNIEVPPKDNSWFISLWDRVKTAWNSFFS